MQTTSKTRYRGSVKSGDNPTTVLFRRAKKVNKPFPSSPGPLYQSAVNCSAFDMEMIFHSHANKTSCALGLILKVRVFELGSGLFRAYTLPQSPRIC